MATDENLLTIKKTQQDALRHETSQIVLWRQPISTVSYAILEMIYLIHHNFQLLISYRKTLSVLCLLLLSLLFIYKSDGAHQSSIQTIERLVC